MEELMNLRNLEFLIAGGLAIGVSTALAGTYLKGKVVERSFDLSLAKLQYDRGTLNKKPTFLNAHKLTPSNPDSAKYYSFE